MSGWLRHCASEETEILATTSCIDAVLLNHEPRVCPSMQDGICSLKGEGVLPLTGSLYHSPKRWSGLPQLKEISFKMTITLRGGVNINCIYYIIF